MNKSNLNYYLGIFFLGIGSVGPNLFFNYWLFAFLFLSGLCLVIKSDKKTWLKILTIIIIPITSIFLFFIIIFGLSDEAI